MRFIARSQWGPRYVLSYGQASPFGVVERSNNANSTQTLSILSVILLFVSILKLIYTDGVDVLLSVPNEVECLCVDVGLAFRRGEGRPLPSFAHPAVPKAGYSHEIGRHGQVPTTQQWLLQSFGLKLRSIEANPQDPRNLLVAPSAQGSVGTEPANVSIFFSCFISQGPLSYLPSLQHPRLL